MSDLVIYGRRLGKTWHTRQAMVRALMQMPAGGKVLEIRGEEHIVYTKDQPQIDHKKDPSDGD